MAPGISKSTRPQAKPTPTVSDVETVAEREVLGGVEAPLEMGAGDAKRVKTMLDQMGSGGSLTTLREYRKIRERAQRNPDGLLFVQNRGVYRIRILSDQGKVLKEVTFSPSDVDHVESLQKTRYVAFCMKEAGKTHVEWGSLDTGLRVQRNMEAESSTQRQRGGSTSIDHTLDTLPDMQPVAAMDTLPTPPSVFSAPTAPTGAWDRMTVDYSFIAKIRKV